MMARIRRFLYRPVAGSVLLLLLLAVRLEPHQRPLLLAPMIGQLGTCLDRTPLPPEHKIDPAFVACASEAGSAADVIESTLSFFGPRVSRNGRYELGYTLNVPLLRFLVQRQERWEIDEPAVQRMVKTIAQSSRPVVLYLFSTHFSVPAPIEPVLGADPDNLAKTPQGPLSIDKHYGMDVYPWSIARTDNSLTQARLKVIEAFVGALCEQPREVQERLRGITMLGEVHHLFPGFEGGMGVGGNYLISDYSQASVTGFRKFLKDRFRTVKALREALGGAPFDSFDAVSPPQKNIRQDRLQHFWEHIDSFAAGSIPVHGWLAPHPRLTGWVQIYLNGVPLLRAHAALGRQDVRDNVPGLGTADVGWRQDLDFSRLAPGIYEVAALAEAREGLPVLLGKREIAILDRRQAPPARLALAPLPPHLPQQDVKGAFDQPASHTDYYYNPLARLWNEFREWQVVQYLDYMQRPVKSSCLSEVPRYMHQLFPYANPSWDYGKYAVGKSLQADNGLRLGVSLYGEAGYGHSFFEWKDQWHRWDGYGITEFHPLQAMSAGELSQVFDRHIGHGAQFLSFFLEGRGPVSRPYSPTGPTVPFFGANNTSSGSDVLYRSLIEAMNAP